jgi:Ca2+/H+ antiporter
MIENLIIELLILVLSLVILAFCSHYTINALEKLIALTGLSEMSVGFILLENLPNFRKKILPGFKFFPGHQE